jgi:hypothetical protein
MKEEPQPPSSWTPDIVRDHVIAIIEANDKRYEDKFAASDKAVLSALAAQEKAVNAALAAAEKAVAVAERNAEEWRKGANEWRGSMTDREANFAKKTEMDALKERLDRSEGSGTGMRDMYGWIFGAVMLLLAVAGFVFKQ